MNDSGQLRRGVDADAVVRPFGRAVERPCARPACSAPADATLLFSYGTREAWLTALQQERPPQSYELCSRHAERTRPPSGWELRDRRPAAERAGDGTHEDERVPLGGETTVAVLAAALRAVPSGPAEPELPTSVAAEDDPSPVLGVPTAIPPTSREDERLDEPARREDRAPGRDDGSAAGAPQTSGVADEPGTPRAVLAARPRLLDTPAPGSPASDW